MMYYATLLASLLASAHGFAATPTGGSGPTACVDMDAPSFSMLMDQLAAQIPFFSPGEYPTCASAVGVCVISSAIASACPIACNDPCATGPSGPADLTCEPPASVAASDFSLDTYISARWFVQESVPKPYERGLGGRCIAAQYERFEAPTDLGYTLKVINYGEDAMGNAYGTWLDGYGQGDLCGIQDATQSQLTVQFCSFPIAATTNYRVLFYDEDTGVALVTEAK